MKKIYTLTIITFFLTVCTFAQQWAVKSPMPLGVHSAGVAVINNIIYVVGGSDNKATVNTLYAYNTATDTWSIKAPMKYNRTELAVAAVNGKIYAIGGYNNSTAISSVEEYDPITNTWTDKSPMPTSRSQISCGVINNKIYVVGGWPGNYSTLEEYDPSMDKWQSKANSTLGRVQLNGGAILNNLFYYIGGKNTYNTSFYSINESYNPSTNSWITNAQLPQQIWSGSIAVLNNQIHYFGGTKSTQLPNLSTHYVYNPSSNTWSTDIPMLNKRSRQISVAVNNKIYVIGGSDSTLAIVNWNHEYSTCSNPIATIISQGNTTFCQGGSVNLNANTGNNYSYQWFNNNQIINGAINSTYLASTSGNYTVKITDGECNATSTSTNITVNPLPNVTINALNNVVYKSSSPIQLVAYPSGGIFSGDGVTGATFNPSTISLGTKTIIYNYTSPQGSNGNALRSTIVVDSIGNVCSTYDTLKIKVKLTTGINTNQYTSMRIYPNPTSDVLIIDAIDLQSLNGYRYRILDVQGKEVYNALVTTAKTEVSLKSLGAKGMYLLHILDANNESIQTKQIVLE